MSQLRSPSYSSNGQMSANMRNFKDLYSIKFQDKTQQQQAQQAQLSNIQLNQQPLSLQQQMQPSSPTSLSATSQSKDQILQGGGGIPSSPPGNIKLPSFSGTSSNIGKLFLNNNNIIPKKVQSKAKMISLNLHNSSQSNANLSQRNQENSNSLAQSQIGSIASNTPNTMQYNSSQQYQTRHQSYQSPTSQGTTASSCFLSKQASNSHIQNNVNSYLSQQQPNPHNQLLQQQQLSLQPPLSSANKHRGSGGSYGSLFNNTSKNTNQSQQQQQDISSGKQKKSEQHELLEKYKNTPFLNYMYLNQNVSPVYSNNINSSNSNIAHSQQQLSSSSAIKDNQGSTLKKDPLQQQQQYSQSVPQSYVSSALHSRNQSQNVLLQQQSQQQQLQQQKQQSLSQTQQQILYQQQQQLQQSVYQQEQVDTKQSSRVDNNNNNLNSQVAVSSSPSSSGTQNSQQNAIGTQQSFDALKNDTLSSQRWSHNLLNKNSFQYQYVIGKGGFGKVWRVENKKNKQPFAMKEMSKSKIITKRSVNSVMSERHLLSQLKHPFLVNMNFAFQDRDNLYLVMDLVNGGDLRFHIGRHRRFNQNQTQFFVACIVASLEYLHSKNVIHRDIKPENLVLDTDGYVKVTDLGVARIWKPENSQDTSGTPGYMAPEVMCRQNHGIAVDYFALGVLAYEFMMGKRPYLGRNRKEIRDQILSKQVQIKKHEIPDGWSIESADFINRLIQRKPVNRLGVNGPEEVKQHPWIKNFPWGKLMNRELDAPFIPQAIEDNYDYRQQISADEEDTNEDLIQQNAILLRKNSVQNLFSGYNYDSSEPQRQPSLVYNQFNTMNSSSSPTNNLYQTGNSSTHSTNNTNIPSDRSQTVLNARKSPTSSA